MNDATFQRLIRINDELVDLCNGLKQRGHLETASRLILQRAIRYMEVAVEEARGPRGIFRGEF